MHSPFQYNPPCFLISRKGLWSAACNPKWLLEGSCCEGVA
ncbi:hypothetical protein X975_03058, partial [Stegodyphus mimosarum]